MIQKQQPNGTWLVCVNNAGYEASLEQGKIYRRIPDREGSLAKLVRVVDESGEDYLYGAGRFAAIRLSPAIRRKLTAGGSTRRGRRANPTVSRAKSSKAGRALKPS